MQCRQRQRFAGPHCITSLPVNKSHSWNTACAAGPNAITNFGGSQQQHLAQGVEGEHRYEEEEVEEED